MTKAQGNQYRPYGQTPSGVNWQQKMGGALAGFNPNYSEDDVGTRTVNAGSISGSGIARKMYDVLKPFFGTPYSWGGGGVGGPSLGIGRGANTNGFDCSGLTEYAAAKVGYKIGGYTGSQWSWFKQKGAIVSYKAARPGDILFFGRDHHHVGIYIGNGKMIDAPRTGSTVGIHNVYSDVVGAGRFPAKA